MGRGSFLVCLIVLFSATAVGYAQQDATVVGTAVDESKAVLPGVTVTALDLATGRQFVASTNERGEFRIAGMSAGRYKIQAEMSGFATSILPEVEILVGQNVSLVFRLTVAALNESVTVTGEAPLIDTRSTQISGNVDRRQMEALPIQGRNWMELSLMVKGVTGNDVASQRVGGVGSDSQFQMNLDGQQITEQVAGAGNFGQPGMSREAIAEYQIITNMFDVTMGRSAGLQLQAVSKSGSNDVTGSLYGYFRDARLNAPDFVAKRVLPYSNQQVGGSLGGPIRKDKLHFFLSYEHEREPNTWVVQPPGYTTSLSFPNKTNIDNVLVRADYQMGSLGHLMARSTYFRRNNPFDQLTGTSYPSQASSKVSDSHFTTANWSRVLTPSLLQELKVSYFYYHWNYIPAAEVVRTPSYNFPGMNLGARSNYPEEFWEKTPAIRYDLTWNKGSHDVKIGADFLRVHDLSCWPDKVRGVYVFASRPADMERRFPLDAWNDPSRWDFTGLDSTALRFELNVAQTGGQVNDCGNYSIDLPRPNYGFWLGDTWRVSNQVTVNYGIRYDLLWGDISTPGVRDTDLIIDNGKFTENVGFRSNLRDVNNIAPRFGITWAPSDSGDLVVRGGTGLFWGHNSAYFTLYQQLYNGQRIIANTWVNDGRPGFIQDPTRGVTGQQILSGQAPAAPQGIYVIAHDYQLPYTWQTMAGFSKRLGDASAIEADLIYWKQYQQNNTRDPNLFYDPVTGFNLHPNRVGRPAPEFGPINLWESKGRANYLALATSFNRRYRNNFQATVNYTHMFFKNDTGLGFVPRPNNNFDLDGEWAQAADFQRSTLRANTILNLKWGFSGAASFSYGSGNRFPATSPVDPWGTLSNRTLADLSIVPRNAIKGKPLHKLDLRLSKAIRLVGRVSLQAVAEVFNVYNHANYGAYTPLVTSPAYGQPTQSTATSYLPRIWQLGARLAF
ncbi:MAG: carboxypeptidase regulatory-like domain-containing protein [Vicinamibacterales bacterium]